MSDLSQAAIEQCRTAAHVCRSVVFLPTIDSTNSYGLRLLKRTREGCSEAKIPITAKRRSRPDGTPRDGVLIVADYQTGGRGREQRRWLAPEGKALLFSLALILPGEYTGLQFLTLLGAVSVAEVLRQHCHLAAQIKWPNDVVVAGRKICGLLTELMPLPNDQQGAVLGIGLNVNQIHKDFPPELRDKATSVRIASDAEASRLDLLINIIKRIDAYYAEFLRNERTRILSRTLELSSTLGRAVRIRTHRGTIEGTAVAIEPDGALVVRRDQGITVKLYSGDVEEIEWIQ